MHSNCNVATRNRNRECKYESKLIDDWNDNKRVYAFMLNIRNLDIWFYRQLLGGKEEQSQTIVDFKKVIILSDF